MAVDNLSQVTPPEFADEAVPSGQRAVLYATLPWPQRSGPGSPYYCYRRCSLWR